MKRTKTLSFLILFLILSSSCADTSVPGGSDFSHQSDTAYEEQGNKAPDTEGGDFRVTCFDVGKGDSFLVSSKDFDLLIDCGYKDNAEEILSGLRNNTDGILDLMIISHFDKDHVGGASKIIKNYPVERIISTYKTNSDKRTEKFFDAMKKRGLKNEVPSSDINIDGGDLSILIIPPKISDYPDSDDNNSSLIVKVSSPRGSMLFTGDAEDYRLSEVLGRDDLDCDVLKVPSHGREFESVNELLDITTPEMAVITSSIEEPASDDILEELTQKEIDIYDTKDYGSFEIVFDEEGIREKDIDH
ncbi:MAG: MBL fold metallo-hydrolase [Lachnospiraceae bacterium]|nr:MBL fold metallo-hydrolase [Lachnospiraceae bacterium]